jgi:alpha-tubulin suppressor-like RCC1 family protein
VNRSSFARGWAQACALVVLSVAALACEDSTDPCDGPCEPEPIAGVTAVAVGAHHGCAMTEGGALYCWGRLPGTAGDEASIARLPTEVESSAGSAQLFAGDEHSCAVSPDGSLACWGEGSDGRLGPVGGGDRPAPVAVPLGGVSVRAGSGGAAHSCVLTTESSTAGANLRCWGRGTHGQLGHGAVASSSALVRPLNGGSYRAIATGGDHSCGIREDGAMLCWGWNRRGQLGFGATFDTDRPLPIVGGLRWSAVALGAEHTCALTEAGDAYCWGRGDSGQLGRGDTEGSLIPVAVGGGLRFRSLTAGREHSCGVAVDGSAYCWGSNLYGRLGVDAETSAVSLPAPVASPPAGPLRFERLAAGALHSCGLTTEGTVYCWGFGGFGQLGTGSTQDQPVPTQVGRPPDPSVP